MGDETESLELNPNANAGDCTPARDRTTANERTKT